MSIKKQYVQGKSLCKVTFTVPRIEVEGAGKVHLVGEFNNWDRSALELKKKKDGDFSASVELEPGRSYQFRYLVDGSNWKNEREADGYVPTPYGDGENCLLDL